MYLVYQPIYQKKKLSMAHVKMSPNQQLSEAHKYWADVNSRVPVYALLNRAGTKMVEVTEDKTKATRHGLYSTYPVGCYYHDEK